MFKTLCRIEKLSTNGILLHMCGNEKHQNHNIKNYGLMENNFHKQVKRLKIKQFNKYRKVFYKLPWQKKYTEYSSSAVMYFSVNF
jgi:hypothetical protein